MRALKLTQSRTGARVDPISAKIRKSRAHARGSSEHNKAQCRARARGAALDYF